MTMCWFFHENSALARFLRTILQGITGVLIAAIPQVQEVVVYLLGLIGLPDIALVLMVPAVMAVLVPLMAKAGEILEKKHELLLPSHDDYVVCDADGNEISLEEALVACPEMAETAGDENG